MMNEKKVKCLLIDSIYKRYRVKLIGVEVPFLSGKRWADVLLITNKGELIAFEIKSDRDSLRRMSKQIEDYTQTFNQVHVILSRKFRNKRALRTLPRAIGCAFIDSTGKKIEFVRRARSRKRLSKSKLLFFLWKKDLIPYQIKKKDTVEKLRNRMRESTSLQEIHKRAVNALMKRYQGRYGTFWREKSERICEEELDYLTKSIWQSF